MNSLKLKPFTLLFLLGVALSPLQAQDVAPIDTGAMLKELLQLQKQQHENLTRNRQQLIQSLSDAAQSQDKALDAYFQAVMNMNFAGASRENTKFKEWKEKEKNKWSDKDFQAALRFYCYYLSLTLRKGGDEPEETLMPALVNYCRDCMAARTSIRNQDIMKKPMNNFVLANWLQVSALLPKGESWEMSPGNLDGIFDKIILPYWRTNKSPYLIDYWDRKIADEAAASEESGLDSSSGRFSLLRRPVLLWNRAQEYFVLGQQNRAIAEMFSIIKAYPAHPQFQTWTEALKQKLAPAPPSAPAEQTNLQ